MTVISTTEIWHALDEVKDPEIPVVSVVEMGIVREIVIEADKVIVTMTPTFSGCPALYVMRELIEARVRAMGATNVEVKVVLTPRWTTDWITDDARSKLKAFGLAPPPKHAGDINVMFLETAACPYCGSAETGIKNTFGPTLCRAIYYCHACQQPFEQFKPI
jgi:ring-1,2-phenylacetyl-CoA epoxidase subunit PaaD